MCPISQHAQTSPDTMAYMTVTRSYTYAELHHRVGQWVQVLERHKIASGQRIGLYLPLMEETPLILWALIRLGTVVFPLNPALPWNAALDFFIKGEVKSLIGVFSAISGVKQSSMHFLELEELQKELGPASGSTALISTDQWASMILTSGSSGTPKIAVHSYGNHLYNALGVTQRIPLASSDRWWLSLPIYHVGGWGVLFRTFLAGAAVVLTGKKTFSEVIPFFRISHVSWVPTQLIRFLSQNNNPFYLKAVVLGGALCPQELYQKALKIKVPVYLTYGLTEMSSQVTISDLGVFNQGRVLSNREILCTKEGDIKVKGASLFQGYFDRGQCCLTLDEAGWYATGDQGSLDSEGNLRVIGRKDQLFISGGENIQPEEIEQALLSLPGIEHAIVVPIPHPEFGERPAAFIQLSSGQAIDTIKIQNSLSSRLPSFKIPDHFWPWPEDLMTGVKPSRARLKQLAETKFL